MISNSRLPRCCLLRPGFNGGRRRRRPGVLGRASVPAAGHWFPIWRIDQQADRTTGNDVILSAPYDFDLIAFRRSTPFNSRSATPPRSRPPVTAGSDSNTEPLARLLPGPDHQCLRRTGMMGFRRKPAWPPCVSRGASGVVGPSSRDVGGVRAARSLKMRYHSACASRARHRVQRSQGQ